MKSLTSMNGCVFCYRRCIRFLASSHTIASLYFNRYIYHEKCEFMSNKVEKKYWKSLGITIRTLGFLYNFCPIRSLTI